MTIDAIASGRFNVALMVTDEYDYSHVQKAFEESISRKTEIIKNGYPYRLILKEYFGGNEC